MILTSEDTNNKRKVFFESLYDGLEGYVHMAALPPGTRNIHNEFFIWPEQKDLVADFVQRFVMTHNVYYCATVFSDTKARKEFAKETNFCWADLDACNPNKLEEQPSIVIETSPNRFQGLWRLDSKTPGFDAEDINRRIAYKYEAEGCDINGWDVVQLLRVPFTYNFKYAGGAATGPTIKVVELNKIQYTAAELSESLPQAEGYEALSIPMPSQEELNEIKSAEELMEEYKKRLQPIAFHLFAEQPAQKSWSESLWQLELFCFEAGMTAEETFIVARESACNKYKRDGTSERQLWKEICRAKHKHDSHLMILAPKAMNELLSDQDRRDALAMPTFVDRYIEWAKGIGDAAPQYHQAGGFVLLSSLLTGPVRLPTSFGIVIPNLWFMILADTTLTRKSTAMDLAMDLLVDVDSDAILATDGSIEGLFGALQFRPGRPSVFLRDEFSGLLEAMTKKDYYAGMAETLTKLYDGKFQKKILRRETIEVKDPVLIVFAGGIRERILQLLTYEHVASGFVPRFIFITAVSDVDRLRPLGPPTDRTLAGRNTLQEHLQKLHDHYTTQQPVTINGKTIYTPAKWEAELTAGAWNLYNHYETTMMTAALGSSMPDLMTPMFDRLSKSGLKAAVLLAAEEMSDRLVVEERHLVKAFSYVEYWRHCSLEVVENLGRTASERHVQTIFRAIQKTNGVSRSEVMQRYHLDARNAEMVLMTLEQRGLISRRKSGRTELLYANAIPEHTRREP
jgi:hypothetical protein